MTTLKTGNTNHKLLTENIATKIGNLWQTELKFPLVLTTRYNIPSLLNAPGKSPHRVRGEVYSINEKTLSLLDNLERYPEWLNRQIITVVSEETGEKKEALVYNMRV